MKNTDLIKAANEHYRHIKETYYKGEELSELEVIDAFIAGANYALNRVETIINK